jgi:hypothetical protein
MSMEGRGLCDEPTLLGVEVFPVRLGVAGRPMFLPFLPTGEPHDIFF